MNTIWKVFLYSKIINLKSRNVLPEVPKRVVGSRNGQVPKRRGPETSVKCETNVTVRNFSVIPATNVWKQWCHRQKRKVRHKFIQSCKFLYVLFLELDPISEFFALFTIRVSSRFTHLYILFMTIKGLNHF